VLLSFYMASDWLPFNPVDITFQEMRSAGDLGLIASTELRNKISAYYSLVEMREPLYNIEPAYRKTVRGLTPVQIQNHLWTECFSGVASGKAGLRPDAQLKLTVCDSPMSE